MKALLDTIGGIFQLARLALATGFRFKGAYWTWRLHTAFGRGYPTRWVLVKSVLEYGRWVHQMRRMS